MPKARIIDIAIKRITSNCETMRHGKTQQERHVGYRLKVVRDRGFYRSAVETGLLAHPGRARPPSAPDYESHAVGLGRNELGTLLIAASLGAAAEHALIPCSL